MEDAVCFRCHSIFVSYRALEVHLMSCDVPFEPTRSTPWAFIPPPVAYRPGSEPQPRHPSSQNRYPSSQNRHPSSQNRHPSSQSHHANSKNRHQQTPRVPPQATNKAKPRKSDTPALFPLPRRNGADKTDRRQGHPLPGNPKTAKCTKCGILFPDSRSLSEHFVESPAHPYSVRAPSNSWDPPGSKAEPMGGTQPRYAKDETQLCDAKDETKPPLRSRESADHAEENRTEEGGKAFQTNSGSAQHSKDSVKEGIEGGAAAAEAEKDSKMSKDQVWADDEVDDITSAFTKLSTA